MQCTEDRAVIYIYRQGKGVSISVLYGYIFFGSVSYTVTGAGHNFGDNATMW